MLLLPGEKKFKTKVVSKLLGVARLSFGDEEYMSELLDLTPGSVSIMGHEPVYIDYVLEEEG